jgi:SAM-dependent methyltransferase
VLIDYTDPNADVPPGVDFLDAEHVREWVAACEVDKPWRVPMRIRFAELVAGLPPGSRVLELGSGPGLLAEGILERCANLASYTLLDFSDHMLGLSRDRLERFSVTQFIKANFRAADWTEALSPPYTAVIAMRPCTRSDTSGTCLAFTGSSGRSSPRAGWLLCVTGRQKIAPCSGVGRCS